MTKEITVLGGGVAGLCVATELVERGCDVTVIDPEFGPGDHGCSWWAGGMLAPDCEGETAEEPVVRYGRQAAEWWQKSGAEVTFKGSLVVALDRDRRELDRFARRTERHQMLSSAGVSALEPLLGNRCDRALHMVQEAHLDPRKALLHLKEQLLANGATFAAEGEPTGQVVDCRGLAAADDLQDLRGVKGEMVILRAPDITLNRPVRLLHPRFPLYIVPRGEGVFMLGATQIESEDRDRATVRSVVELLNAAYALHPSFGEAEILEIGVDARPAFPDNLPRVTRANDRLYVNGLFRHGYLMAPALAQMVGDYLQKGEIPELWKDET
ncbi:MAG: FAD-dependent oxidoreductase [Cognatishimia sp.]